MRLPDQLTCLLRNLHAGQEATVRTRHGTKDWFQTGKGILQGYLLSPSLFNLYVDHIMRNAGMDGAQGRIKIAGRNINNVRYADNTTLMAKSEEELKRLFMKVKEESEKAGLKFNIKKIKIMDGIQSHHFMANRWRNDGNSHRLSFLGSKITADGDYSHEIKLCLLLERKTMTNPDSILKSRDITLLTKVHMVKTMVFPALGMDVRDEP